MLHSIKKMISGETIELKQLNKIVSKINALEESFSLKTDKELQAYTQIFRDQLNNGISPEELIIEAFAVVREASKRVLGLRHYDSQLMGGAVLTQSQIAQMQTGEGKTLVVTLPAYVFGAHGKGTHIITANEYLATRDFQQMKPLFEFLGLTVGLNISGLEADEKQEAYNCDITYGTGTEFGFDYLRDHMVKGSDQLVQRPLFYALIDEVDSILIDEARTPLIIAGKSNASLNLFPIMHMVIESFEDKVEYDYYPETKQIVLLDEGADRLEEAFGIDNVYDSEHREFMHIAMQSLRAKVVMRKDVDYIVKDDKIMIVDPYTGRVMEGRTFSDGLHQAIEAKEKVSLKEENNTQASVMIQHYFRLYKHVSGMTGSAVPSKDEFWETYYLRVTEIPTNKPNQRKDLETLVYLTSDDKIKKIIEETKKYHDIGRPVLIGTTSIQQSEKLSIALKELDLKHSILNAKTEEDEAEIISNAGQLHKIMLATNMAGRGTDIILGEGVPELGGLHIIGTELHSSARIDMQLRGRGGRQGDPGSTQFIISLEDELFYYYDEDEFEKYKNKVKTDQTGLILAPNPSKFVYNVQKVIEGTHFSSRSHLLKLDDINNDQQSVMYNYREKALYVENMQSLIIDAMHERKENLIQELNEINLDNSEHAAMWNEIIDEIKILSTLTADTENIMDSTDKESKIELDSSLKKVYSQAMDIASTVSLEEDIWPNIQSIYLETIDRSWITHLDNLHHLREGINIRGYGQEDPYRLYAFDALHSFNEMLQAFFRDIIRYFLQLNATKIED
ncbi:preprotein translocase subunit SecA [Psychrobacillus psychrodurans]|uniref:preprotein translocase subunit SecA n=1 Tax=Psychrobacillus psychrodurans TaxID=126157 RepID=UPI001F4DBE9C|nr:preprotein translocase subunit SecA [Psychrobacillus psychrodurans]MCK1995934.1 preprotein translocase subunit SecA [Psychrobacillus psychrodurans]